MPDCKDCGNFVSLSAEKCPHCGRLPVEKRIWSLVKTIIFAYIFYSIVLAIYQ